MGSLHTTAPARDPTAYPRNPRRESRPARWSLVHGVVVVTNQLANLSRLRLDPAGELLRERYGESSVRPKPKRKISPLERLCES